MLHPIEAFRDAMTAAGLRIHDEIIDDGKIHRFTIEGDKPRSKNGWYVFHSDGIAAGAFGSWKHDMAGTWCAKADHEFTQDERRAYAKRMDDAKRQREAEQEMVRQEAREKAARIWDQSELANDDHPYLVAKGVRAYGLHESRGSLVVPVMSPDGVLQSLQFIDQQGGKLFLSGGMKRGCYFRLGNTPPTDRVIVAEGYATAATLHEAHGCPVAVAFDAGNLGPVCDAIRAKLPPHIAVEVWADNDNQQKCGDCDALFDVDQHPEVCPECGCLHGKKNTGVLAANKSAAQIGATVMVPASGDFNDMAAEQGIEAVAAFGAPANDNPAAEPMDLFAEFPVPAITRDMLPKAIADYAFDSGELIGVDPAMIAMPALVSCAAALHDAVKIQPKRHETGWTESARLWCAVVGSPSVKKSPAIKRATKRLRKIDMELHEDNAKDMARHLGEMEAYKDAKKEAKKTGEQVTAPEPAQNNRMVVEDITVEALSEILKCNSRGVLCIQDELSGWFGAMDAYSGGKAGGKDRAHWLEAYNGGGRVVDRVMRGNIHIPNWSVSMIGGIQPDAIRRIAANMTDDGLMQRFMIIVGGNAREHDRPEDSEAGANFAQLVDYLYGVGGSERPVTLSEEAHQVRENLNAYSTELADFAALPGGLRSHLGKWTGLFARLLLTFHAIECHATRTYPVGRQVSGETAQQVDQLMRRYLLPHAMAYYTDILGAATDLEHARWIAGHVLSKGLHAITNREIMQAYKQWRGLDDFRRSRIMLTLEDMGWLVPMDGERQSRKGTNTWAVVSKVHTMFAKKGAAEAEKRERIRQELVSLQMAR